MAEKILKKTLVLGASDNPGRYSFQAINRLRENGHPVLAIGGHQGQVGDVHIETERMPLQDIDTVTIYLNPANQTGYYDYLLNMHPARIIFNPGAGNPRFRKMAVEKGINCLDACTLVLLATGQY